MNNKIKLCIISFSTILLFNFAYGNGFLDSYRQYKISEINSNKRIDSIVYENSTIPANLKVRYIKKERKRQIVLTEYQIRMLDTIFKSYKKRSGYDFNIADTVIMIYTKSHESTNSSYIIISGTDTISFRNTFELISKNNYKPKIDYETFFDVDELGRRFSSERDSIVKYSVLKKTNSLKQIVNESPIVHDGQITIVVSAIKTQKKYKIEIEYYRPFVIRQKSGIRN